MLKRQSSAAVQPCQCSLRAQSHLLVQDRELGARGGAQLLCGGGGGLGLQRQRRSSKA